MHVFDVEVWLSFLLQNGLPAFSDPRIIEQSFHDTVESNVSTEGKVAEGNKQILKLKEDFDQLLVQVSSLKKDLHHLMHQHIVPIRSSLPNASSAGVCCCYSENDIYPRFVLINDQPVLNLQLMSCRSFHYRLYDYPSTSSSLSPLGPGSRETSSPIPDSNASHHSSIALPIHISATHPSLQTGFEAPHPSLQTGFEAPQPSPADGASSLEAPTLEDVSSSSDEDSRGDIWGTPPSGGVGEDRV